MSKNRENLRKHLAYVAKLKQKGEINDREEKGLQKLAIRIFIEEEVNRLVNNFIDKKLTKKIKDLENSLLKSIAIGKNSSH